ncbi:hypothetical protein OC834_006859, partial [Tilletia horrida]
MATLADFFGSQERSGLNELRTHKDIGDSPSRRADQHSVRQKSSLSSSTPPPTISSAPRHAPDNDAYADLIDEDLSPYEDDDDTADDETERPSLVSREGSIEPGFAPRLDFPAPPVRPEGLTPNPPALEHRAAPEIDRHHHQHARSVQPSPALAPASASAHDPAPPRHVQPGPLPAFLRQAPPPQTRHRLRKASSESQVSTKADYYRRTAQKTDLDDWTPPARTLETVKPDHGLIPNLPDWTSMRNEDPTSYPTHDVQRDVEYSITRLISPAVFKQFLEDRLGRHRFREYMNTHETSTKELDFVLDIDEHIRTIKNLRKGSEALHEVYVRDGDSRIELPPELGADLVQSLRATHGLQHQLEGVHSHLVQSIFNSAFQRFIRASITEQSRVRLGSLAAGDGSDVKDGLGAAFVLTNPRLRDHPIVLVSPTFCELTGYPQEAILQRNCRFLQGPSTSPASIQRIRDALNAGGSSTELLLNYRRNGEPFWNLLSILPLRDAQGRVSYFVGGQVNVTGSLTTKGLSFLLGGGRSYESLPNTETTRWHGVEASPTLLRYVSPSMDIKNGPADNRAAMGRIKSISELGHGQGPARRHVAAGSTQAAGTQLDQQADFAGPTLESGGSGCGRTSVASGRLGARSVVGAGPGGDEGAGAGAGGTSRMKRFLPRRKPVASSQSLGRTAESETHRRTGGTLEEHMDDFAATYSRLALVKQEKREVLFVTSALLEYFGQP